MSGVSLRPLAIIVAEASGDRLRTALTLGCAAAAMGRPVHMLFDGTSVAALQTARAVELRDAAIELGVRITACQTGLAEIGLAVADLVDGVETGGMVGFLARVGDAELVIG